MDILHSECPTDILVDIKEDKKCPPFISDNEPKQFLNAAKSRTKMFNSNCEKCTLSVGSCPTGVLVDVPPPTGFCLCDNCEPRSKQNFNENVLNECEILNTENLVSMEKIDRSPNYGDSCKAKGCHNSTNSSGSQSEISVKRLRWKTPSPQSMRRINKEASKVIDHLNSSSVFYEDLLLTEEILPITLNFDELDDDTNEGNSSGNVYEDVILKHEATVNVHFLNKIEKNFKGLNCNSSFSKNTPEKIQDNLKHSVVERNLTKLSFAISSKNDTTSKESYSSGVHSSPLVISDSMTSSDEDNEVFNVKHIPSEDKENMQMKLNKLVLTKENKIGSKTSVINKPKLNQRSTLRNLSNVKQETFSKRLSLSVNKSVTTPFKKMNISTNKKETASLIEKPQMKKFTSSVGSVKNITQPNSFRFQNKEELISGIQKPQLTLKLDSGCSSLSSDVKQQNLLRTPSRRYSLCPPLKSASAIKAPLTPAMTSSHNFAIPRYTPQPVRHSRLSFSRSWQQSSDKSQFFSSKEFKPQFSTTGLSSTSKVASSVKNSSKPLKPSFSQSMSAVAIGSTGKNNISTSSKGRFSSKLNLPSPLTVQQDTKLARALFTNVSEQ